MDGPQLTDMPGHTTDGEPSSSETANGPPLDLAGGPFAVVESDPGEFELMTLNCSRRALTGDTIQAYLRT